MSSESIPITPARFAEALKDLSLSSLHLKVLELRNSIAHLDYSNEQLRPYAEGREVPISTSTSTSSTQTSAPTTGEPDPDCVEAIKENEQVIARMQERIQLVRAEVEHRGFSWSEFQSKEEAEAAAAAGRAAAQAENNAAPVTNGINGDHSDTDGGGDAAATATTSTSRTTESNPWTDGTFQTGVIRNGEIIMDSVPGQRSSASQPGGGGSGGGSISDEELRRRMEEQLRNLGDNDDEGGGLHL